MFFGRENSNTFQGTETKVDYKGLTKWRIFV